MIDGGTGVPPYVDRHRMRGMAGLTTSAKATMVRRSLARRRKPCATDVAYSKRSMPRGFQILLDSGLSK